MLRHHWRKCHIYLVLASGVQIRKERTQKEALPPNKNPVSPSKCRFLSKFLKAHSCNSLLTSINGPCLCAWIHEDKVRPPKYYHCQVSSPPDLPTAPDGLAYPSLTFPEGVGDRRKLEKRGPGWCGSVD